MEDHTAMRQANRVLEPEEALSPARLFGPDRRALTELLEQHGVKRLTIDRGENCQTVRRNSDGWHLTCRNVRY